MKKFLRIALIVLGVVVLLIAGAATYIHFSGIPTYEAKEPSFEVELSEANIAEGKRIASMLCNHCHRGTETNVLSGQKVLDFPPSWGSVYSANITQHPENGIGEWSAGNIAYFLKTGVRPDGTFTPFMPKFPLMSDDDMEALIAFLKSDDPLVAANENEPPASTPSFMTKFLSRIAFKPYPYTNHSAPNKGNPEEHGAYLVAIYGCFDCHSASFQTNNALEPEKSPGYMGGGNKLLNEEGNLVLSPNITMHETGIGSWTEADFTNLLLTGRRPNDKPSVVYPMMPYPALDSTEVHAIYTYLKGLPPIDNKVIQPN